MTEGEAGFGERLDGIFIDVEVDDSIADDPALAAELEEVCPVDIFAAAADARGVRVVRENLDECVLCELCIEAVPPGRVRVLKLYDGTELRRP